MLYVTTRNDRAPFTADYVLKNPRGPDGGMFVPNCSRCFTTEELTHILSLPFDQCLAQVLNRLLGTKLGGWDVSFYIGRFPVRMKGLNYRTWMAEGWHNPDWSYDRLVSNIRSLVCGQDGPGGWLDIAVQIAVFAGICGEMQRNGHTQSIDIAVVSGDFTAPIGAWYARSWGLPIGNILCCCNENGNLWDLIANGQMRTDGISIPTEIPEADVVLPAGLEYMISACGGTGEVQRYLTACQQGKSYIPPDAVLEKLRSGLYVSVVGGQRIRETIPRLYASRNYLMSPYDALCYCGLQDYRARFSETGAAVIFSKKHPRHESKYVTNALGISLEELQERF